MSVGAVCVSVGGLVVADVLLMVPVDPEPALAVEVPPAGAAVSLDPEPEVLVAESPVATVLVVTGATVVVSVVTLPLTTSELVVSDGVEVVAGPVTVVAVVTAAGSTVGATTGCDAGGCVATVSGGVVVAGADDGADTVESVGEETVVSARCRTLCVVQPEAVV